MTYQSREVNGLGIYSDSSVDLLSKYTLYWLLNYVCCVQVTCAGWVYILGGGVKILSSNKTCVKQNTFLFSLGIFQ